MKKGTVIFLMLFSMQTFAQWKSYYPEGTTQKKKKNTKKEKRKNTKKPNDFGGRCGADIV